MLTPCCECPSLGSPPEGQHRTKNVWCITPVQGNRNSALQCQKSDKENRVMKPVDATLSTLRSKDATQE